MGGNALICCISKPEVHVRLPQLKRAFKEHGKIADEADKNSHHLLRFYADEWGEIQDKIEMAKDKYHDLVRDALEKDGWTITDDPLRIQVEERTIKIDLGAEKLIAAEKEGQKIAVEIKSFIGHSVVTDFYLAIG